MPNRRETAILLLLLVGLRVGNLTDPLFGHHDHRMNETAAIARNFHELGLDPLRPRIDWGGAGPGYLEEACQIYAFAVASLYRLFGVSEAIGRGLSLAAYAAAGIMLFALVRRRFPGTAAPFALFFFAIAPLGVFYGRALQPDAFGLALTIAGILSFDLWAERGRWPAFAASAVALAAAALTKPPNLYVGLPLLYLAHKRFGWGLFRRPALWAFAALALVPSVLWYRHAHTLWLEYGNTAGIWGEGFSKFDTSLLLGRDFYLAMAKRIVTLVTTLAGWPLLLLGLVLRRPSGDWLLHVWAVGFGVVVLATAGAQRPHDYYQLPAVGIAAALMGRGAEALWSKPLRPGTWAAQLRVARVTVLAICAAALILSIHTVSERFPVPRRAAVELAFARRVQQLTPPGSLVLVAGWVWPIGPESTYRRRDPDGVRFGTDPVELYQGHRKGWFLHSNRLTPEMVRNVREKGARFLISRYPEDLDRQPGVRAMLDSEGREIERTSAWVIYALGRDGR